MRYLLDIFAANLAARMCFVRALVLPLLLLFLFVVASVILVLAFSIPGFFSQTSKMIQRQRERERREERRGRERERKRETEGGQECRSAIAYLQYVFHFATLQNFDKFFILVRIFSNFQIFQFVNISKNSRWLSELVVGKVHD